MANQEQVELLKQGVEVWNEWRRNNPEAEVDLSDAYLRKADLVEADLRKANLDRADLIEADLSRADLSQADLFEADLRKASLVEANLRKVNFVEAVIFSAHLNKANLSGSDLFAADLSGANLSGANLSEVNLKSANLKSANLKSANLSNADLMNANLNGANLSMANLIQANLSGAQLLAVDLTSANMLSAQLLGVDLTKANLKQADLSGASLTSANLIYADLREANLSKANLLRVQALATDFTGVNLTGTCLEDWNYNNETKLHQVDCAYFYEKYPDQERRPSDPARNFEPGEFSKLFQKALNTVDLIFRNGLDWKAFAETFNEVNAKIIDEYGGELFLQGYEVLGEGLIRLRVIYPEGASGNKVQQLLEQNYELQLQIAELHGQVKTFERMPPQILIQLGDNRLMDNRTINTGGGNYVESNTGTYIQGNYIALSQDLAQAAVQIQNLLDQLETQGMTKDQAQGYVANEMRTQAEKDPSFQQKMVKWGQSLGDSVSKTVLTEGVKAVLRLAGVPL